MTITVENVNEAPKITFGPTRDKQAENEDTEETEGIQIPALTYMVMDDDANDVIKWSLSGNDADAFKVTPGTAATDLTDGVTMSATLAFKKSPNFEKPTDANMDNMYMVTVVATDKKKLTATRDVVITVTNVNDPGKITFSSVQPKVRIPFTAILTDEDGIVDYEKVKWEWHQGADEADLGLTATNAIDQADSDTYTPKAVPSNNTDVLHVQATYIDSFAPTTVTTARGKADNPIVLNMENRVPEFREGGEKPVMQATRSVAENTMAVSTDDETDANGDTTDDVGDPVMATDLSVPADTLTYTLGGPDASLFRVRQDDPATADTNEGGQIEVGADTKLDYEKKKSYMVTVTATDPSLASATIDVTINVTDVNEPPDIAGEDDITDEFQENSTSTIETFRATDPERRTVYWSLTPPTTLPDGVEVADHADNGHFKISKNGQLSFNSPPNFERPRGTDLDTSNTNAYKVVVFASDDVPGAGIATARAEIQAADPILVSARKFTVQVTNVAERGSVTVDRRYPQVGVAIMAMLMDGDATNEQITAATWQWYKGSTALSGNGASSATYTPQADDTGTLRVETTYQAKGANREASATVSSVRAVPSEANVDPTFPSGNNARTVKENLANTNVGPHITATDTNSADRGKLTYSLETPAERDLFSINAASGQLKTKAGLDHEANATQSVTVTVTDPAGGTGTSTVTVTVEDVNEAPMFGASATDLTSGPTRVLDWRENTTITTFVATYPAFDPDEGAELVWSLTGADAADFEISNEAGSVGQLTFKESPDYEMPAASNNLYRVTVEVSDGKLKATRPVTVMVVDVEEDGEVTLSSVQPKEAIELTASLEDSDGGVTDVAWQWWKSLLQDNANTVPTFLSAEGDPITTAGTGWEKIADAKSDTYTPVKGDINRWLTARAIYTDRTGPAQAMHESSANTVIRNTDNRAPVFKENDQEITETTRYVEEAADAAVTDVVVNPDGKTDEPGDLTDDPPNFDLDQVMATDPNEGDNLTYTLGGTDMASFSIVAGTGQLRTKAKLDHEAKNTYMVTVTATDPNGLSDSIDVTIMVVDKDEAPEIMVGGLAISVGPTNPDHPENSTADVGTYTVVGSMKDSASWTLTGNDASHFMLEGSPGMSVTLKFESTPDYEMPMDADMDNVYEVSVEATDSESKTAMRAVTITVTNEEETGEVTLWAGTDALTMAPQVGYTITGAVMDPDGGVMVESWQWSRTMTPDMMDSWMPITGATDAAYMVTADDVGYYLRVMATYTDAAGTDMAMEYSPATMMVTMNAAPMFDSETGTREVAENTVAGENVGVPVTAMDADAGDTLTYSLSGTDMASFAIDPATGQITVGAGTMLDSDTKATYTVTVTATDAAGATDSIDVTVTVTDVDEGMPMDLLTRYDDDDDGWIQLDEARDAVGDYFISPKGTELSLADARKVIGLYFDYKNRSQ